MNWIRRSGTLAGLMAAVVLAAGCAKPLPAALDSESALVVLTAALDAWKGGGTPENLLAQKPAVRMIDRDWQEGRQLVDYTLTSGAQQLGLNIQCPAELTLGESGGKTTRTRITYVVHPGDPPVITRLEADF